jgi:hypothetical protein
MSTYSINNGQITEAVKLNNLQDVFIGLPDNTSKLIAPVDVRNAVYTTWENILLKSTIVGSSSVVYTGYDLSNLRQKFYFGKKTNLGMDIMTNTLLSGTISDVDVFFYNNKSDVDTNQNTKIAFLAGTTSYNFANAPYIEARQVTFPSSIDLYINNTGYIGFGMTAGKIDIDAALVSIKGVRYPVAPTSSSLFLTTDIAGNAFWASPTITNISNPGATVSIVGSPVLVNGYPLEYTNAFPSQVTVGGIPAGTTFSNVSVSQMFDSIFYPYLTPIISLNTSTLVYEYGSSFAPQLFWSIQARTLDVTSATLSGAVSPILPGVSASSTLSGTSSSLSITTTNPTASWTLDVSDGTVSVATTIVATRVFPFFYGMTSAATMSGVTLYTNLTKDIDGFSDKAYLYSGINEFMYFAYPSTYGTVSEIFDQNLYQVYNHAGGGAFTYSLSTVASTGLGSNWSTSFYVYKTNLSTSNYGYQFQFVF